MATCEGRGQNSAVAGNIGIARCKALVWDHDPFQARAHQILTFPFSAATEEQMKERVPEAIFEVGAAILRPTFILHDMYIFTLNPNLETRFVNPESREDIQLLEGVDLVGSVACGKGQVAANKLPGGFLYDCDAGDGGASKCPAVGIFGDKFTDILSGRSIFPHQCWRYVGNLFSKSIPIHPSEYELNRSEQQSARGRDEDGNYKFSLEQIHAAVMWDYTVEDWYGRQSVWAYQTTKHAGGDVTTNHWSIEKWTPTWQGQDFVVSVKMGEKELDRAEDPNPTSDSSIPNEETPEYAYLMYNPSTKPKQEFALGSGVNVWVDNISNEAFYIPPDRGKDGNRSQEAINEAKRSQRQQFDWRFKNYLLIEIGHNHSQHNYFIELVAGRVPRFLHLGEEWDHPKRLDGEGLADSSGFEFIVKCRELDKYPVVSSDTLFRSGNFKIFVRSHLGRIVVTFEGYEDQPWVISRLDNDPTSIEQKKQLEPMVVPSGRIRIHGGNISCAINYSPMEYVPSATVKFTDRQADTFKAKNKDLYITFANIGNSERFKSETIKEQFFRDKRLKYEKIGYDDDAYLCYERHRNIGTTVPIYELFNNQYLSYGKGWYEANPYDESRSDVVRDPDTLLPLPKEMSNYVSQIKGGKPHALSIVNLRNPGQPFKFGVFEQADRNYEYPEYVSRWDIGVQLQAGSIRLPPPAKDWDIDPANFRPKTFKNHITPIAASWSLVVLGGEKPFKGKVTPFDISSLISQINDSWSAEGYSTLNHEMQIRCYLPQDPPIGEDGDNKYNLAQKLIKLHDKSFYVTVSYWWDIGIGKREVIGNKLNNPDRDPEDNDLLIQMTGVAYGAELEKSVNKLYMNFTVKDYMSVLKNQFIFNSPFFDGVQDTQSVYDLSRMAGFDDDDKPVAGIDRRPLGFLEKVIKDGDTIEEKKFLYNGEFSRAERYDLKGSYASLAEPSVRFQNGETYESAIKKIADLAGKTVYFDRWGVLKLETTPAIAAAFASTRGEKLDFESVFDFVSSPFPFDLPGKLNDSSERTPFEFDPNQHAAHLVYNVIKYQRSVEDAINQIVIFSASNDIRDAEGKRGGGFIVKGYTFFEQIWDPESEGFFGYRKPFYQSNGVFGSLDGVQNALALYAKMKYPPVKCQFETYGIPGLKALDIITLDGNFLYITEISHEIDPATNRWWSNISAEWLKNFTSDLGFLLPRNPVEENGGGGEEEEGE